MLAGLCLLTPALANIYAYTTSDGSLSLSNMQQDDRYAILVPSPSDRAAGKPAASMAAKANYDGIVEEVAQTYGLESALLHAVISVESHYRPNAVSKAGAVGLMQLMPLTARYYGVADPLDPVQNLHGGARYLSYLLKLFDNDISLALAAYNAGETAVAKYGNRIPPYRETENYVPKVMGFYRKYRAEPL
jgi:soluble lytic murein transglycosylase-like protein